MTMTPAETIRYTTKGERGGTAALRWVHTLVVGSGAAGLNAAIQLRRAGIEDVLIVTEGLEKGTSINTGSDKQTYYKLALYGADADAPALMAGSYVAGGSMHGDLAMVEAALSARAFLNLVNLGVPFPRDAYGQFVGYKTDHDPRQRATSVGPYTSRDMCRVLIQEVKRLGIPVLENRVVVELLTQEGAAGRRAIGAVAVDGRGRLEVYGAENVVYATGGPGGLYQTSVYPDVHAGGIGVALMAGALAQSLPESQYGLASTKFRWNVSGTYMQVVPRFVSTSADGSSDAREFMRDYFDSVGAMNSRVFLKGYQWPFDSRKIAGGSSLVDILVYIETVLNGRRVFLDFRDNPAGFSFEELSEEARQYLVRSNALQDTPLARLRHMNPGAIALYREHGIRLEKEPLEVAVCAQHNNGGLAANLWWESLNIAHLFPVGEVNGSHGVYRPGGAALNAGQVGGFRAAEFIAARYARWSVKRNGVLKAAQKTLTRMARWAWQGKRAARDWKTERDELQARMSRAGAHIRAPEAVALAVEEARDQWRRVEGTGCRFSRGEDAAAWMTRQLCFAHWVYLSAIHEAITCGLGSRGSAIVLSDKGTQAHPKLEPIWRFAPEDPGFRNKVQNTRWDPASGSICNQWVDCRPLPSSEGWFETAWAAFRNGRIYDQK